MSDHEANQKIRSALYSKSPKPPSIPADHSRTSNSAISRKTGTVTAAHKSTTETEQNPDGESVASASTTTTTIDNSNDHQTTIADTKVNGMTNTSLSPSGDDIDIVLCKMRCTEKYSKEDVVTALITLRGWASMDNCDAFLNEFLDVGGVPRVLVFLENNSSDMDYLRCTCSIVASCTDIGPNRRNQNIAEKIAAKILERNGMELLLRLVAENHSIGNEDVQSNAIFYTWSALKNMIMLNKTVISEMLDNNKQRIIIKAGISLISSISNCTNDRSCCALLARRIFEVFGMVILYAKIPLKSNDFENMDVFQKCTSVLKDQNGEWKNNRVWNKAAQFFAICCEGDRRVLSKKKDFKCIIIPFCTAYIKLNPRAAMKEETLIKLLRKAIHAVGDKKEVLQISLGLTTGLGSIIESSSECISQKTKDAAYDLLNLFFN